MSDQISAWPTQIQVNLDHLDELAAEQAYNRELCRLWDHALHHLGCSAEDIKAFTFRDAYLDRAEDAANSNARSQQRRPVFSGVTHHNAVRITDDSVAAIPMIARPEIPKHMKVRTNVKS